ncbi:Uncharacterised protein r2_g3706 [Pycnogonum litorale]
MLTGLQTLSIESARKSLNNISVSTHAIDPSLADRLAKSQNMTRIYGHDEDEPTEETSPDLETDTSGPETRLKAKRVESIEDLGEAPSLRNEKLPKSEAEKEKDENKEIFHKLFKKSSFIKIKSACIEYIYMTNFNFIF